MAVVCSIIGILPLITAYIGKRFKQHENLTTVS